MNRRIAFPFLTLPDEAICVDPWMIGDSGQPLSPAGDILDHWDYARDLEVGTGVSIDWNVASEALQLPVGTLRFGLELIVGTGAGSLPRRQYRLHRVLADQASNLYQLSGKVSGTTLSGRLRLSLHVTLDAPCGEGTVLSPKALGNRLWHSHHDILIEDGGDSRFPLETVSFAQVFPGRPQQHAPWYLHWRPGAFQADFSASVRLYVNSDRPEILDRVVAQDGPTLQAIMADVVSQMVGSALDREDIEEALADCDEGSVGRQIRYWLDHGFPGQDIAAIRCILEESPGTFRAVILAASEMGVASH